LPGKKYSEEERKLTQGKQTYSGEERSLGEKLCAVYFVRGGKRKRERKLTLGKNTRKGEHSLKI